MEVKKGGEYLTKTIESIMTDYGGNKYLKVDMETLREDCINRLKETLEIEKGSIVLVINNLRKKLVKASTKEQLFTELSEVMFQFQENI